MKNNKNIFLLFFSILFIWGLMPSIAHAAPDLFEIPPEDKSKLLFMDKLFDSSTIETLEASPLNSVILIFNTCVLMLGGILAAYTLVAGTMSTAHEGEMLGKKWSAMWLPIRTTVGAAFIFPTMGGFCTAQIIVIWLIHQGIGLANSLWGAYLDNMPMTSMASYAGPDKNAVFNLSMGILRAEYCKVVVNDYYERQKELSKDKSGEFPKIEFFTNEVKSKGYNLGGGQYDSLVYNYGFNDKDSSSKNLRGNSAYAKYTGVNINGCGSVSFDFSKDSVDKTIGKFSLTSLDNFVNAAENRENFKKELASNSKDVNAKSSIGTEGLGVVNKQKIQAVDNMRKVLEKTAEDFYRSGDKPAMRQRLYNDLNNVTLKFVADSKNAAGSLFESNPKEWASLTNVMKQDGWMYAGTWYIQLYRIQTLMSNVSKVIPTYSPPMSYYNLVRGNDSKEISGQMILLDSNIKSFSDAFNIVDTRALMAKEYRENAGGVGAENGDNSSWWDFSPAVIVTWVIDQLSSAISSGVILVLENSADNDNVDNPLGLAYAVGDRLENAIWAFAAIAAVGAVKVFSIVATIMTFLSPLLTLMFIISNILTVVLPFMPFFLWIGAILGWAVLCIEAIIAAPLWVMIHIHPDGDGVVGRGGAGYGMVLSLTVRPALMIMGLIAAMVCIGIFAQIINDMFMTAFYTIASRSNVSLLQMPIIFGTYAMALFIVIKKSFSLIHVIPDEILKWLGVNNSNSVEKSSNAGLQSMMAAKMVDDSMGRMSLGHALDKGKQVADDRNKAGEALDRVGAGSQLSQGNDAFEQAANDPEKARPSPNGNGATIREQNEKADGVINSLMSDGKPSSSMNADDRKAYSDNQQIKADNLKQLLASGAEDQGSAAYERIQSEMENAQREADKFRDGNVPPSSAAPPVDDNGGNKD